MYIICVNDKMFTGQNTLGNINNFIKIFKEEHFAFKFKALLKNRP